MKRDQSDAVNALLSLLADTVNIVDGKITPGCGQGATVGFTYTNPIDRTPHTATGYTLTECPSPNVTAFRSSDGKWYLVGQQFAKQVRERLLQRRQKRPREEIADQVIVGYLYTKTVPGETAVLCPPPDPAHPDEPVEPPPRDPYYPDPSKMYGKSWVSITSTAYPDEIERWFFEQPNCGLPFNESASSMGWLPEPPHEDFYLGMYVSSYLSYVHTLYTGPSLDSEQWIGYSQIIGRRYPEGAPYIDRVIVFGVSKAFSGGSAPDTPPSHLYVYLGETAGFSDFSPSIPFRLLSDTASPTCAPRLPPAPQPPTPPPLPPDPADRKSVELWFNTNQRKAPLKLKKLSEQETMGKGDIVWLSPKQALVIYKYGNAKHDGAPNTIDRGYCRLSIFKIPGDSGAPFTEIVAGWELVQAGAVYSGLLALGVAQKSLFIQALSTCSFYADDAVGYLDGQPNPLYAAWIKAGSLRANLLTCGARQLRNLSKDTPKARVYLPDPYPPGVQRFWRPDSYYATAPIAALVTKAGELPLRRLEVSYNPTYDRDQPESATNSPYDLYFEHRYSIKKFKLPAAAGVIQTIACIPIDQRLLR